MLNLFRDNHKRRARWIELYADIESLLHQMKEKYKHFKELNDEIHDKLGLLYTEHDFAPQAELHEIWKLSELTHDTGANRTPMRISSLMMCTAAVIGSILLLAPQATAQHIGAGLFDSAWAAELAGSAFGPEVSVGLTAGALTAGAVAAMAAAGIRAVQQMVLGNKLRRNIQHLNHIRAMKLLTLNRLDIIIRSIHYIKYQLDQMQDRGDAVTRVTLQQMVVNFVEPAVTKANALQLSDAVLQLNQMDQARASWTQDDVVPTASPKPQRFFQIDQVPIQFLPSIPADLKALSLTSPDTFEPKEVYPVLRSNSYTYWPLSYADHRIGMAIVVFDSEGNLIKRWDKIGARYIVDITANPTNHAMIFRGESNHYFSMSWSELGAM
ncbi:hypothetical protein [Paenibacillus sp. PDC88]|uniref:hypothetical protein n=1 Tax=Paenibacillus sp. PDC88 TaxID=1884375 RepID=UPI000896D4B4|nr:hypothetical protein [Paenibacillus sp. PDC88]SDW71822.1 hypothetical protein SAMN05518848_102794 [Paenibacillus sp. PDC88]